MTRSYCNRKADGDDWYLLKRKRCCFSLRVELFLFFSTLDGVSEERIRADRSAQSSSLFSLQRLVFSDGD